MSLNVNNNVATNYATQQGGNKKTADRLAINNANTVEYDSPVSVTISAEGSVASNYTRVNGWQDADAMLRHFINVVRNDNCPRSFNGSGNNPSITREESDRVRYERARVRNEEKMQFINEHGLMDADGVISDRGKDHPAFGGVSILQNNAPSQDQLQLAEMLGMNEAQHKQMANMITGQFNNLLSQHAVVNSELGQRIFDQVFDSMQTLLSQFQEANRVTGNAG